jgi:hypothetical protein
MPTVQDLLDDVRRRVPASTDTFTDSVVIGWFQDTQLELWRYMASTEDYEFDTQAGIAIYPMASDMRIDMIKSFLVSNSTVIDGTEEYTTYEFSGQGAELTGYQYYDAFGQLGIYPAPTSDGSGYRVKVFYESAPATLSASETTTVPSINVEYQDILKWKACQDIAGSGNSPDLTNAAYYQALYDRLFLRIKMDYAKRKAQNPSDNYRRSESWWQG